MQLFNLSDVNSKGALQTKLKKENKHCPELKAQKALDRDVIRLETIEMATERKIPRISTKKLNASVDSNTFPTSVIVVDGYSSPPYGTVPLMELSVPDNVISLKNESIIDVSAKDIGIIEDVATLDDIVIMDEEVTAKCLAEVSEYRLLEPDRYPISLMDLDDEKLFNLLCGVERIEAGPATANRFRKTCIDALYEAPEMHV